MQMFTCCDIDHYLLSHVFRKSKPHDVLFSKENQLHYDIKLRILRSEANCFHKPVTRNTTLWNSIPECVRLNGNQMPLKKSLKNCNMENIDPVTYLNKDQN